MGVVSPACFWASFTPVLRSIFMLSHLRWLRFRWLWQNTVENVGTYCRCMQCDPHGQVDIGLCAAGVWSVVLIIISSLEAIRLLLVVYVVVRGSRSNNRGGKKGGERRESGSVFEIVLLLLYHFNFSFNSIRRDD